MASQRFAQRLLNFSKYMHAGRMRAASAVSKNADAAVGSKLAECGPHLRFKQPRNMYTAAVRQAEDSACHMKSGREARHLRRGGAYSPFGQLDMFDSFFPNRTLRSMIETMDRFFEEPLLTRFGSRLHPGASARAAIRYRTPWDFSETKEAFRMRVDLPGLSKEELKVFVEDGSLIIKGESLQEKAAQEAEGALRQSARFHTKIVLPENVNHEAVKAELKNGVLSVEIPKFPEIEAKKTIIDVQVA